MRRGGKDRIDDAPASPASLDERTAAESFTPIVELWPDLRFLGMGAWWAWILLCYSSFLSLGSDDLRPFTKGLVLAFCLMKCIFCRRITNDHMPEKPEAERQTRTPWMRAV